jgi:hypothetical protein
MKPERFHEAHTHKHGEGCGHIAIMHEGHVDYLHDGHLHNIRAGQVEEHTIAVSAQNPDQCTPAHRCAVHEGAHKHGKGCGHEAVPHGDHTDYLVGDHLHHQHGEHCDDHGLIAVARMGQA